MIGIINFFEAGFLMWVGLGLGFFVRSNPKDAYALILSFWAVAFVFDPYIMGYNYYVSFIGNTFSTIFWLIGSFIGSHIKSDSAFDILYFSRITRH